MLLFTAFLLLVSVSCYQAHGQAMGSIRSPEGCQRSMCNSFAQWTVDGDNVTFEMEGESNGYIALGLSADTVMGTNGIDDVLACHRDTDGTTVNIKDTYNIVVGRGNNLDTIDDIISISGRIEGGRIICSFSRAVTTGDSQDRSFNESVYIFLARSGSPGAANVGLNWHGPSSMNVRISPSPVAIAQGGNPDASPQPTISPQPDPQAMGSIRSPEGCQRSMCNSFAQWTVDGDNVTFEMEGESNGYIALGLSADTVMGTNGIDDVLACHRDTDGTTVNIKDTYNVVVGRGNNLDAIDDIISISGRIEGGRIICSFSRAVTTGDSQDRSFNESVYIFLARSGSPGAANVGLNRHGPSSMNVRISPSPVAIAQGGNPDASPQPTISPQPDPQTAGSFSSPRATVRWTVQGGNVTFQMEGESTGYIALGLSADTVMGTNGIDDVLACHRDTDGTTVNIKDTYNVVVGRGNNLDATNNLAPISASLNGGRIMCNFTRVITTGDPQDRSFNEQLYLFLATSGNPGAAGVGLNQHGPSGTFVAVSSNPVIIAQGGSVGGAACGASGLIRAHGIFMFITWGVLVQFGYFFAAYMKPAMVTGLWFQIHRAIMLIAIVPSVIGFILIFVEFRGNQGLIRGFGSQNPTGTTHMIFGVVILLLQFINPVIALVRCKPDSKYRWIFNIVHGNVVGWGVIFLAWANVSLGLWQFGGFAGNYVAFYVWLAFMILYNIWDVGLFIYQKFIFPSLKKRWDEDMEKENGSEMQEKNYSSADNPAGNDSDEKPKKKPSKDTPLRYVFLGISGGIILLFGIPIFVLIAVGCNLNIP